MSLSLSALRELVAIGLTAEQILRVAEAQAEGGSVPAVATRTKGAERQERYRQRLEASGLSAGEWRDLSKKIVQRDGKCAYCGSTSRLCYDHVDPIIQGGRSDEANLVAACSTCNQGKSGRTVEEWKGAEWAAAWRTKRHVTTDVTLQNEGASLPLPPSPQTPQPPTPTRVDNTPLPPEGRSRRKPSRPIPAGFPTDEDIAEQQAKARAAGANLDVRAQAERFRNHAEQNDRRCADWRAAWRNWIAAAIERAPKTPMAALAARPAQPEDERWRRWLREFRQNGHWPSDDAGPRPGHPACRVPPALLAEFGFAPPPANDPTDLFDRGAAA
jgi:5-methylcytosine-specific restriction endonuclease McrA